MAQASCSDYNCTNPFEDQLLNDCNEKRVGGIREIIILACGADLTDPTDASEINTLIANDQAFLYKELKVGMDAPSAITQETDVSCDPEQTVNYDRTLNWVDANVNDTNVSAYNTMNAATGKKAEGALLWDGCGNDTGKVFWIDSIMTFEGGLMIPNNDDANQKFEYTAKWRDKGDPRIYDAPAGIFGQ